MSPIKTTKCQARGEIWKLVFFISCSKNSIDGEKEESNNFVY